jgi:lysyl-tRNA synthetase class 2
MAGQDQLTTTYPPSAPVSNDANSGRHGIDEQIAERRAKLAALMAAGVAVHPYRFDRTATTAELHASYAELAPDAHTGAQARVAGRLLAVRGHGKLEFADLHDGSGRIQLLLAHDKLDEPSQLVVANLDVGDWVGAEGEVVTSRRGELSIEVAALTLLTKALRPLPDLHVGVVDPETKYREREVDLIANADDKRVFDVRHRTIAALRTQLQSEGFIEVETPILQAQAGGAIARPFTTHSNALDVDLSLRIAPELYLKRLIVGGYERVFEIGKDFRNEGIDTRHSPEFTAMEAYRALGDMHDGMDLTERLIVGCARHAADKLQLAQGDVAIDLTPPFPRRQLLDLVAELAGQRVHPSTPVGEVRAVCDAHGVPWQEGWGSGKLIFEIYDKVLQPGTVGPVFVCGYPIEVSPLARRMPDDPTLADRFELVINAKELANGYSELNDADDQMQRFEFEASLAAAGDVEAHPADMAFVQALQYGLPPTSGIGIGVDRLVMLLAEVVNIRDVILFPILRPR